MMKQIDIYDIVTEEFQSQILDSFAYATGFGVACVDHIGRRIGKGSNYCQFCIAIKKNEEYQKLCEVSNQKAMTIALSDDKPGIIVCHAGLINIEIPLIFEGKHMGAITAGQVFCEDIDYYPKVDILSNELLNPDSAYAKYRKEVKVMTRRQVEATAMALFNISNFIMQKIAYGKIQQELLLYQKQQIELEHKLKLAELDALHKQVTPHFIFSVINSVSRLIAMQEYCTADKMLSSFAQMLRYSLSNIQANVSLLQELNYIENYLAIQQMRFVKQIRYQIDCDSALAQMQVPFFSLQPLVENSIVHGLLNLEKGGELKLRCSHKSDYDEILLSDNGIGIDAAHLEEIKLFLQRVNIATPGNHVGIYNSYQRFRLLYQDRFDFEINSIVNIGTTIHIRIRRNL